MKKSIAFFGTMALTLGIGVLIGQISLADTGSVPGSADDPVVTKSYVDSKIASLGTGGNTGGSTGGSTGSTTPVLGIDTFTVLKVSAGKVLKGGEGTELILRGGSAVVVTPGADGVSDITVGIDIKNGQPVTKNHMLLTPRNDGRGIKAMDEIYVMVRGTYTVQ